MNRFRTKKRAKDDFSAPRPSMETTESSGPFKMFGKGKKSQEEPKAEPDIAAALPPSDDFRTSLLMTGLSARFSMLREADDPNSKMGKASDDSVLFPKRQSRMDFGLLGGGLHDIAEVESLNPPPFARMDSFYSSDDGASTGGSIMNRPKPTDGNNLFGGRQKIYKLSSGVTAKNGGMGGRALYEDDVAQSAFQRWRQAERERRSLDDDRPGDSLDPDSRLDYSHRRETNSTTSSMPSGARNSTAATSIASSQPAPSLKDWQPPTTAPSASTHLERTVTRTRRLYEQSLTQDLHDQQSSAVSRMDTLSKRSFGTRTPDLTPTAPSPTNTNFGERPMDRRPLMGKASAPNLRSFSPPATSSPQASPADIGNKFPGFEQKSYGTTPPLSPPISETEEHPMMSIQPNDRGKATAMGVFSRPAQQYDETKYSQRQRQMQQGRETPTNRFRTESNASVPTSRSRSSSSLRRAQFDKAEQAPVKTEPTVQEETQNHTFFDDDDDASIPEQPTRAAPTPQVLLERPDDHDHPAFRKSALPTPLSVPSSRNSEQAFPAPGNTGDANGNPRGESPEDSPTLGPPSGLSGMVRQHLRNVSTASSVYGAEPEPEYDPRPETDSHLEQVQLDTSGWGLNEDDWNLSYGERSSPPRPAVPETLPAATFQADAPRNVKPSGPTEREQDDFARHLADGARRVREKLTSYADPDTGRSTPLATPYSETSRDFAPPRSLDIRPQSSRSSLADRREYDGYDQSYSQPKSSMDVGEESRRHQDNQSAGDSPPPKEEKVHAGLKAFRQARRELQKMKQMDLQNRHGQKGSPEQVPQRGVSGDSSSRSVSRDDSDRERSGSEASNGRYAGTYRNGPAHDAYQGNGMGLPVMRAPVPAPTGMPPAGPYRAVSTQSLNVQPVPRGYESGQPSPISPLNGPSGAFAQGPSSSTPNLNGTPSAPPLPPINPRRKTIRGGSSQYGDDESAASSPRLPSSPDKQGERTSALVMPDDLMGPDQFRQRLRRVPAESNGMDSRTKATRASPPRGGSRPPPPKSTMSSQSMHSGVPGGMI